MRPLPRPCPAAPRGEDGDEEDRDREEDDDDRDGRGDRSGDVVREPDVPRVEDARRFPALEPPSPFPGEARVRFAFADRVDGVRERALLEAFPFPVFLLVFFAMVSSTHLVHQGFEP